MGLAERYQTTWLKSPLDTYIINKQDGGFKRPPIDEIDLQTCQRNINGTIVNILLSTMNLDFHQLALKPFRLCLIFLHRMLSMEGLNSSQ